FFVDWALVMPLTLLFTTGVAYAIGSGMRRGFGPYLVVLLLVLAVSFPFNQALSQIFMLGFGAGPMTTTDFSLTSYFPITGLPIFPHAWPLAANRLFTVGAGLAAVALVIWLMARRRRTGSTRLPALVCAAGAAAVLLAFGFSRLLWAQAMAPMIVESYAVNQLGGTERLAGLPVPTVGSYDLSIRFATDIQSLHANADIAITATGDVAPFSLNCTLQVQEVTGPDGAPVPFARSGDMLLITTAGRTGTYRVVYSGQVWQWREDSEHRLALAGHITPESIVLQEGMAWYPVPGRHPLVVFRRGIEEVGIWHEPVPFRLSVSGAEGLHIASNTLDGQPVSQAWLIGTPRAPVEEGGLRFYADPAARESVNRFAAEFGPQIAWYEQLVPLQTRPQVIEVPASLWALRMKWETDGFPGAIVVPPTFLPRVDGMTINAYVSSLWWNNDRTEEEGQVHDILKYFMTELYQVGVKGWDRPYISVGRAGAPKGTETEQGQALLEALRQFHKANGLEATGRVLRSLYNSPTPLTYPRLAEAMQP
ncbi:MAG TPA: hypothetical protein VD973_29215, partial [Symbiobacteriaceae bacterium]|nr:hypothetical protein [Symbiobacteriaceae bacterium]